MDNQSVVKWFDLFLRSDPNRFVKWLEDERQCSDHTKRAYIKDVSSFFVFLNLNGGKLVSCEVLHDLKTKNVREWLVSMHEKDLTKKSMARSVNFPRMMSIVAGTISPSLPVNGRRLSR